VAEWLGRRSSRRWSRRHGYLLPKAESATAAATGRK
jgi:hypothetical protein